MTCLILLEHMIYFVSVLDVCMAYLHSSRLQLTSYYCLLYANGLYRGMLSQSHSRL